MKSESTYILTIIKTEDDPNYEKKLAEYKERHRYFDRPFNHSDLEGVPKPKIYTKSLETTLTHEEFKKVKTESLKVFE